MQRRFLGVMTIIEKFEGFRAKPYRCPAGKLTIGYGFNLEEGITKHLAINMAEHKFILLETELLRKYPTYASLDSKRQSVLLDMAYNMGVPRLMKFKKTLKYIKQGKYKKASIEMLDSKWHRDFVKYDMQDGVKYDGLLRSEYLSKIMKGEN